MAFRGRPQSYARPENALKRAEELENVGQRGSALQTLHDIVTSKKHRTWSKTHESIMIKHLDLVVEMKKRNYAKEALMQYRNMCQAVNIASLEEVIKYFLKKTSDKAEEAQNKAAVSGGRERGREKGSLLAQTHRQICTHRWWLGAQSDPPAPQMRVHNHTDQSAGRGRGCGVLR